MSSPSAWFGFVCLYVAALGFVYLNKTNQPDEAASAATPIASPAPQPAPANPRRANPRPEAPVAVPQPEAPQAAAQPPAPSPQAPAPNPQPEAPKIEAPPESPPAAARFAVGAPVTGLRFEPVAGGPAQSIDDLTQAGRAVLLNFDASGEGRHDGSASLLQNFQKRYGAKLQVYTVRRQEPPAGNSVGGRLRGMLGQGNAPRFPVLSWSDELAQSFGVDEARSPTRVMIDGKGDLIAVIAAPTAEEAAAGAKIDSLPTLAMRHLFGGR